MEFNIGARYTLETEEGKVVLCFKHAVQAANKGKDVELEVINFDHDEVGLQSLKSLNCRACYKERHDIVDEE